MKILISNDDGVYAPGLRFLAESLAKIANITVVAPDRNRSGASNSLTLTRPLRIKQLDNEYYSVDGTPTDCVHLAVTGFLETKMDIVVSGINDGANLGDDVLYSGTVAAAMEGRYMGLPAIAFSMAGEHIQHYRTGAEVARELVSKMKSAVLPSQTVLNVNIPDIPLAEIRGVQITRLGKRHLAEPMVKGIDPRGRPIYWVGPPGAAADAGIGTDFYAISQGYVSVTPLQFDMTNYDVFDDLKTCVGEINWQL